MDVNTRGRALARLKRISGQVDGVRRMVEAERYCVDILLQIAAVQAALGKVGKLLLDSHARTCVAAALASGDADEGEKKIAELMEVFSRYGHIRNR